MVLVLHTKKLTIIALATPHKIIYTSFLKLSQQAHRHNQCLQGIYDCKSKAAYPKIHPRIRRQPIRGSIGSRARVAPRLVRLLSISNAFISTGTVHTHDLVDDVRVACVCGMCHKHILVRNTSSGLH